MAGSESLAMPLGRSVRQLLSDLDQIERVVDEAEPAEELRFVEQLRSLKAKDPRVPGLAAQLGRNVREGQARLALAYPFERDEEHGEAQAYRIRVPRSDESIVDEPDLQTLAAAAGKSPDERWLDSLGRVTVQALVDDAGEQVVGRAIPGNKWITAEVTLGPAVLLPTSSLV